jgi:hypothetical protein
VDLWTSDEAMSNHYATSVHRDGILYGFHGRQEFGPSLRAVELKTGKVRWNLDQFRAGTVTLAGDRLLIVREGGEMILAPASPDALADPSRDDPRLPSRFGRLRLHQKREHAGVPGPPDRKMIMGIHSNGSSSGAAAGDRLFTVRPPECHRGLWRAAISGPHRAMGIAGA